MKKRLLSVLMVITAGVILTSCKNKADQAKTSEAEEVAVAEEASQKYVVNLEESTIEWKGFKPTGTHNGIVNLTEGDFLFKDNTLQSGNFVIDMKSIVSLDLEEGKMKTNLENHLKGTVEGKEGDFFNVNLYPTAKFEITGLNTDENGQSMLSGNLTIKDKTQNIEFPVSISSDENSATIASESFTIDRTQWGVNYGSKTVFDNLGDRFINDDVELKVTVKATKA